MAEKAFIFDLNGTIINDMAFHEEVWHRMLHENLGVNISMEETKKNMYGKNEEVLERILGKGVLSAQQMHDFSIAKETAYQEVFLPHLELITGLGDLFEKAYQKNIPMGIGTAAIPFNVDYVLDNLLIRKYFGSIITASDVQTSKPDPEVFLKCAAELGVAPQNCIVFEDAPKGVEAARNGGMKAVAITTYHTEADFLNFKNVLMVLDDYRDERLNGLL